MPDHYRGRHRSARPYLDALPEPDTIPIPTVAPPSGRHTNGDGLDDVRAALAGPIRQLIAHRPDLAHTRPLVGVR